MNNGRFIRSYNIFECCKKQMSHAEMRKHLTEVHKIIEPTVMKATKSIVTDRSGLEWTEATYKWKLEDGTTFLQYIKIHKVK